MVQQRPPVYFIAHGGPSTMYETWHGAYQKWIEISKEIRYFHQRGSLKGIVFVSAHWQAQDLAEGIYVNVDESNPLIYDFYGFPDFYYESKFHSRNPWSFSSRVISHLRGHGVKVVETTRGLDHGVWAPLKVGFAHPYPETLEPDSKALDPFKASQVPALPETLPLVQVSLPRSERSIDAFRLGKALRGLRNQGYAIIGGGQPVHNLREFGKARMLNGGKLLPTEWSLSFTKALTSAMTVKPKLDANPEDEGIDDRWKEALLLEKRHDFYMAHPTAEHFLPALVAFGSAFPDEQGIEIFDLDQGPLAWNMY